MTDDLEECGHWRDSVETRLARLEVTVGEQARLRAAMDEDLSKLHVERKLLQSLHDTQQDHTARLTRLETGQERLETGQEELQAKLERVHLGVEAIRDMLDRDLAGDN